MRREPNLGDAMVALDETHGDRAAAIDWLVRSGATRKRAVQLAVIAKQQWDETKRDAEHRALKSRRASEPAVQKVGFEDGAGPVTVRMSADKWYVVAGNGNWGRKEHATSKAAKTAAKAEHKKWQAARKAARKAYKKPVAKKAVRRTGAPCAQLMAQALGALVDRKPVGQLPVKERAAIKWLAAGSPGTYRALVDGTADPVFWAGELVNEGDNVHGRQKMSAAIRKHAPRLYNLLGDDYEVEPVKKKTVKKKKKTEKVCATAGYGYVLDGDATKWRTLSDERWDTEIISGGPVTLLGRRRIDGVEMCVFKRGKKVMAQSCLSVNKC